jgi:hypothetical protein
MLLQNWKGMKREVRPSVVEGNCHTTGRKLSLPQKSQSFSQVEHSAS